MILLPAKSGGGGCGDAGRASVGGWTASGLFCVQGAPWGPRLSSAKDTPGFGSGVLTVRGRYWGGRETGPLRRGPSAHPRVRLVELTASWQGDFKRKNILGLTWSGTCQTHVSSGSLQAPRWAQGAARELKKAEAGPRGDAPLPPWARAPP